MNAPETQIDFSQQFLTADKAAERLGVTRRTLEDWTRRYNLPHMKIGGKVVRYDWNDLQKAIKTAFAVNTQAA